MKKSVKFAIAAVLLCAVITTIGCSTPASNKAAEANDKAILVVSFGTSYNESRNITIGGIEAAIKENFPDYEVRRAFTAQIIIDKLQQRDGIKIDNVKEALDRLVADGFKTLIVQPTHLMHGYEYDDLAAELNNYKGKFSSIAFGEPLLTSNEDISAVIACITARTASYVDDKTAVVFMGHGTEHAANAIYAALQDQITAAGYSHYFIGTVEAIPSLDDVMAAVKASGFTRVVMEPLMVVAGDHANNDMAGDEADSWKSAFEAEGIETISILEGLGQFNEIQEIYIKHVKAASQSIG
jgi:sirohydrochlorin cobaltochelatase